MKRRLYDDLLDFAIQMRVNYELKFLEIMKFESLLDELE